MAGATAISRAAPHKKARSLKRLEGYYENKNVLISGATGFVGKVCLIKLLSSFESVGSVYVVIRAKNGLSAQQRFNRMLNEPPFVTKLSHVEPQDKKQKIGCQETQGLTGVDLQIMWRQAVDRMKTIDWSKVIPIDGDMSKHELGLSDSLKEEVWDKVNVIFNIAASVAFDAPLKQNLRDNYSGASNILGLASKCRNLSSFVHVSTFFSNWHKQHIEEKVLPMERDCEKMAELISKLPDSVCKSLENPQFMENRPNTYIYTKAMTEELVQKFEGRLPIAIVRPSIVVPAHRDPMPGWVDNVNGPMGLGALASIGILRTIDWNYDGVADFVPVDMVANSIIAIAERTARLHSREIKVYNCSSSSLNPLTWGQSFEVLRTESHLAPPYKTLRVPIRVPRYKRANPITFASIKLSELLFAYLIDLILIVCGQKALLVKLTRKLHHGYEILKPFTTKEYTCSNDNLQAALDDLDPSEREIFDFDIAKLDMKAYFHSCYYGCRMGILKEDISNRPHAVTKLKILKFFSFLTEVLLYLLVAWLGYKFLLKSYGSISWTSVNHLPKHHLLSPSL